MLKEFPFIIPQVNILNFLLIFIGRYWVKLYFRGKLRKIEVDDRILFYNK